MNISRPQKGELIAALLLGGLVALLLTTPARSAEPFRLDRLAIVLFSPTTEGRLLKKEGVLDLAGEITWRGTHTMDRPANVQDWAVGRTLVKVDAWIAFHKLGGNATANFEVLDGGVHVPFGDEVFMTVGISAFAHAANGRLINLSIRARLDDGEPVVAGFVIENGPRPVLIRAVGPGLARFGVGGAHPNPRLVVMRGSLTVADNDDHANQVNADRVAAAAARVGAFPLEVGSLDAAVLAVLPPGAYTVHVAGDNGPVRRGDVLAEVYSVPEDVFESI